MIIEVDKIVNKDNFKIVNYKGKWYLCDDAKKYKYWTFFVTLFKYQDSLLLALKIIKDNNISKAIKEIHNDHKRKRNSL